MTASSRSAFAKVSGLLAVLCTAPFVAGCAQVPDALGEQGFTAPAQGKAGGTTAGARPDRFGFHGTPTTTERRTASKNTNLSWHGGKIVAAAKVYNFYWGNAFAGAESSERARYDGFLSAMDGSWDFVKPLNQYGISPVTFLGSSVFPFNPSASETDEHLRATLTWAIRNGYAPWPDASTIYQVFMPQGTDLAHGNERMCKNFCGYHGSYDDSNINEGLSIRYVALPRPDCGGCVYAQTTTDRETVISSHELSETVTDADVNNHRLGWYDDPDNQEIGDICSSAPKSTIKGYLVQAEWSNADKACVGPHDPSPDFAVGVNPPALTIARGTSASIQAWAGIIGGYPGTPTLTVTAPAGITVSAPESLPAGISQTLTLQVDEGLGPATYSVVLAASDGTLSHSEVLSVQVTAPQLRTLLQDGAESGLGDWQVVAQGGEPWRIEASAAACSGANRFRSNPAPGYSDNTQSYLISAPLDLGTATQVTLTYAWKAQTESNYDFFSVLVTTDGGANWDRLQDFSGTSPGFPAWAPLAALDLSAFAGHGAVQIAFGLESDGSVGGWGVALDDLELDVR